MSKNSQDYYKNGYMQLTETGHDAKVPHTALDVSPPSDRHYKRQPDAALGSFLTAQIQEGSSVVRSRKNQTFSNTFVCKTSTMTESFQISIKCCDLVSVAANGGNSRENLLDVACRPACGPQTTLSMLPGLDVRRQLCFLNAE